MRDAIWCNDWCLADASCHYSDSPLTTPSPVCCTCSISSHKWHLSLVGVRRRSAYPELPKTSNRNMSNKLNGLKTMKQMQTASSASFRATWAWKIHSQESNASHPQRTWWVVIRFVSCIQKLLGSVVFLFCHRCFADLPRGLGSFVPDSSAMLFTVELCVWWILILSAEIFPFSCFLSYFLLYSVDPTRMILRFWIWILVPLSEYKIETSGCVCCSGIVY